MNSTEYHILNGDSLNDRMSEVIGEKIVLRECLVVGNVQGASVTEFFKTRMEFFEMNYDVSNDGYKNKVVSEISKILQIEDGAIVNLWFENDLFCQVNFWFTVHVLHNTGKKFKLFLVSPTVDSWLGYGTMTQHELNTALFQRKEINGNDQKLIGQFWRAYQARSWQQLRALSGQLSLIIDNLKNVVEAHIERFPEGGHLGRPQKRILKIVAEAEDLSFGNVFREFCKTEGIYGFGDLQVEQMMRELNLPIQKKRKI